MYQSLELWLWYSTDTAVDLQHCAARVHTALGKNSPMSILYSSLADLMLAISKPSTLVKFGSRLPQITPHIALCCCNQLSVSGKWVLQVRYWDTEWLISSWLFVKSMKATSTSILPLFHFPKEVSFIFKLQQVCRFALSLLQSKQLHFHSYLLGFSLSVCKHK